MNPANLQDLNVSGVTSAPGGAYRNVTVQGIGKVHGDIDCIDCNIEGVSEIVGNVKAESVSIRGKAKVKGEVTAEQIDVEGHTQIFGKCEAKKKVFIRGKSVVGGDIRAGVIVVDGTNTVEGDCHGHEVRVNGKARISGGVFAENIALQGVASVGRSCEAEHFRGDGAFHIEGLLNAGTVRIRLERSSSAKEIGGDDIRVERGSGSTLLNRKRCLTVDTVEGDQVYLEHTTAKVVRGNRVTLGPSTRVELVEYRETLDIIGNAKVGERKQV